jgi:hypothetical protein
MAKRLTQGPASPVYLVDELGNVIGTLTGGGLLISDGWEIITLSDVTLNNSIKTFTVAAGYQYQILWVYASFATTATVGTRQMVFSIHDGLGTQTFSVRAGVTQIASLTYAYSFAPSLADLTAVRDSTFVMTPIPPTLILNPGQIIRIGDSKAIAAGADDLSVFIQVGRKLV